MSKLDRITKLDFQYILALLPSWVDGDEDPTALEVVAMGGWEQVEQIRKRIGEIRERLSKA